MKDSLKDLISQIKRNGNIPSHVAIIMDGNGRWAKKQGLARIEGHKAGIESVRNVVQVGGELSIKAITLYTFSSENWKRPKAEVSALMSLLLDTIRNEVEELNKKNVKLMVIGDFDALPPAPRLGIRKTIKYLSKNTGLIVNLALSYSSRQEIVGATKQIASAVQSGKIQIDSIDENLFAKHMQTWPIGDPDLLIRTSGEQRISNFLLWQIAYSELYITPVLWPDFGKFEFLNAIQEYQKRERRFGKVSEQLCE